LDVLEIFLDNIQNSREPEAKAPKPDKLDMNPIAIQTLNCGQWLHDAGLETLCSDAGTLNATGSLSTFAL